jgi:ABC-type transport system involved in multi-copper enzyme maturation permease subunit
MKQILVIAHLTFLESLRRKDFFVLFILAGVIMGGTSAIQVFGVSRFDAFLTEISLFVITWSAILIAVTAAARQMPTEIANRTLYPLLAKPLGRFQLLLGKFFGVGLMCFFALTFLYLLLLIVMWKSGMQPGWIILQNLYLRFLSLLFLTAMTIFLSLILTHAANICLSLLITIGISIFATALTLVNEQLTGIQKTVVGLLYAVLPHFELFNLNYKVIHQWDPIPAWVLLCLTGYAALYIFLLLCASWAVFKRKVL